MGQEYIIRFSKDGLGGEHPYIYYDPKRAYNYCRHLDDLHPGFKYSVIVKPENVRKKG